MSALERCKSSRCGDDDDDVEKGEEEKEGKQKKKRRRINTYQALVALHAYRPGPRL